MGKADVFTGMSLTEKLIWLKQIKGSGGGVHYQDHTAEGNPVIFTTNFAQNAKALSVDFAPKQNLNGYDRPWAGGNGKNLGEWADGYSIASSGKIQVNQNRVATINPIKIQSNAQYVVSGVTGTQFIYSILNGDTLVRRKVGIANGSVLDTSGGTDMYVCAFHPNTGGGETKVTVDSCLPQIEIGSAPSSYEPYENICPITGMDSIDVVANSVTHEFDLGRTVYGGTLNAKTGVLTVTDASIASYNGETLPSTWISDRDEYKAGTTPTIGAQVVYRLATPLIYQLTAQQIALLEGENVIATDGDNLNVTYQVKV